MPLPKQRVLRRRQPSSPHPPDCVHLSSGTERFLPSRRPSRQRHSTFCHAKTKVQTNTSIIKRNLLYIHPHVNHRSLSYSILPVPLLTSHACPQLDLILPINRCFTDDGRHLFPPPGVHLSSSPNNETLASLHPPCPDATLDSRRHPSP